MTRIDSHRLYFDYLTVEASDYQQEDALYEITKPQHTSLRELLTNLRDFNGGTIPTVEQHNRSDSLVRELIASKVSRKTLKENATLIVGLIRESLKVHDNAQRQKTDESDTSSTPTNNHKREKQERQELKKKKTRRKTRRIRDILREQRETQTKRSSIGAGRSRGGKRRRILEETETSEAEEESAPGSRGMDSPTTPSPTSEEGENTSGSD